jgi:ABC-type lipoprotein export system ATPase subunit
MSFGTNYDESYAEYLLEKVGLVHRLSYKPSQLSIGQQQRVALARALVNKPKLVLADEPTGNLDSKNARNAINLLCELCRETDTALLVVSHDERVVSNFKRQIDWTEINNTDSES